MRIALFIACYNDTLFPRAGIAVTELLERLGHTVDFPTAQTCCGQMHYNTGYHREAVPIIRRFVEIFRDAETICVPSASCVAMMREHYALVARSSGDARFLADVQTLLPRVFEFSELLTDKLAIEDVGASFPHRVTYHPSCHSLRMLHVDDKPVRLLRAVRGLEYIPLEEAEQCCGFGGTFAVKNAAVSAAMLSAKTTCIAETRAEVCAALDTSCLMQIHGGLGRNPPRTGTPIRTMHLAEILNAQEGLRP